MSDRIKLVRNDTRPAVIVSLTDATTGSPISVSAAGDVVHLKFREEGTTTILATLTGTKLVGKVNADGSITSTTPYDVPGAGGRVSFSFAATPTALQGEAGNYEAEIEITFADTTVQTVYDLLKFKLREDF